MKSWRFQGIDLEIDVAKTKALYTGHWDVCQCDFCTNSKLTAHRFVPVRQVELLEAWGANPWDPVLSAPGSRRSNFPLHFVRRISCWLIHGRIIGADRTPSLKLDRWNSVWAAASPDAVPAWNSRLEELDDSPFFYLIASNALPWLQDEVGSFRREFAAPCSVCGSRWRETGYLKRNSLIPEWYGAPELREALRSSKKRVLIEFCRGCGRMEDRIVEDKPPFRRKSNQYRDYLRSFRGRRYHYTFTVTPTE